LTGAGGWRNIGLGFEQVLLLQDWLLNFSCAAFGAGKSLQVVAEPIYGFAVSVSHNRLFNKIRFLERQSFSLVTVLPRSDRL
jgi:hypothetical protein